MKPPRFAFSRRAFWTSLLVAGLACAAFPLVTWAVQLWSPQPASPPAPALPPQNISLLADQPDIPAPEDATKALYDSRLLSERRQAGLPLALPPAAPYKANRVVYLTFDDGPEPQNTPAILDLLQQEQVKATFFLVGTQIEKHPAVVQRIFAEGHAIGNHTYDHVYRNLYQSAATYLAQLEHTDGLLKNIIGYRPRISRAPGGSAGSFDQHYWTRLKEDGYIEVGWNVSSGDASAAKATAIAQNVLTQLKQPFLQSHAIVLMHDGPGHQETVRALPGIIRALKAQNYEFRVVNAHTPAAW